MNETSLLRAGINRKQIFCFALNKKSKLGPDWSVQKNAPKIEEETFFCVEQHIREIESEHQIESEIPAIRCSSTTAGRWSLLRGLAWRACP